MSALDITKIATALGSTKIKDRNDALTLLEELCNSQTTVNSKSFTIISSAIFDAVERDLEAINKTTRQKSGPATTRLERMSVVLCEFLEKSLLPESVIKLKFRNYLDVMKGIIKYFKLGVEELNSTMESFTRILNLIILQSEVLFQIEYLDWDRIFSFIISAIDKSISLSQRDQFNNRILSMLLISLCNFLNCSKDIPLTHVSIFTNGNYRRLHDTLEKAIQIPRLSPNTAIAIMKIINKLVIVLCTEDICFVHGLILLGIKLVMLFSRTNLDSLWTQFGLFLNLEQFHCYLDINGFKQNSQELDLSLTDSDNTHGNQGMDKVTYNLKVLILHLLSLLEETSPTFKATNLSLNYHAKVTRLSLGIFPSVYLASGLLNTLLLISAVAKLVDSYYTLREKYNTIIGDDEDSSSLNLSMSTSNKRRKVSSIISSFQNSITSLQYFKQLLSNKNDTKSVLLGLQLILIQSEFGKIKLDTCRVSQSSDLVRTTVKGDSSYDFSILLSDNFTKKNLLVELVDLIEVLDFREWAFLCCRSFLFWIPSFSMDNFTQSTISDFCCLLVQKSIAFVNEYEVAADTIYVCIKLCEILLPQYDFTADLIKLLENVSSKGPRNLSPSSYHFWFGCNIILSKAPSITVSLSEIAQEWLISKMQQSKVEEYLYCSEFFLFIQWLQGSLISLSLESINQSESTKQKAGIDFLNDNSKELFYFILQKDEGNTLDTIWYEPKPISKANDSSNFLLRLLHVPRISLQDPVSLLRWSFVLSQVATCMGNKKENSNEYVLETIESYSLSLAQEAQIQTMRSDQILNVANSLSFKELKSLNHHYLSNYVPDFSRIRSAELTEIKPKSLVWSHSVLDSAFRSDDRQESPTPLALHLQDKLTEAEVIQNPLDVMVKFKLVCYFVALNLWDPNHISEFLGGFEELDYIGCVILFLDELKNGVFLNFEFDLDFLTALIRGVGTKILAIKLGRYELAQVLACRLSCILIATIESQKDRTSATFAKFKMDCEDIFEWIILSFRSGHFKTESALKDYFLFFVMYSKHKDSFLKTFSEDLKGATNNLKIRIKDAFVIILNYSKYPMTYYRDLYAQIGNILNSIEHAITSCFLLTWVGVHVNSISCASLFNLLEGSKTVCLQPYIMTLLRRFMSFFEVKSTKQLFALQKRELLTYWCHFNNIYQFPFGLLGFNSLNEFLFSNSTELVAIDISTARKTDEEKLFEDLIAVKQTTRYNIIVDCIPLIIPFAYTRNGIRNKVFDYFKKTLGSNSKKEISGKLDLTISQILQYTNISKEPLTLDGIPLELYSDNSIVLEDIGSLSITLSTSLDLMSTLVTKFSNDKDEYWASPAVVHFLLRRILSPLRKSCSLSQKVALVRRIKLILLLSHKCKLDLQTLKVVIGELISLIKDKELVDDIYKILIHLMKSGAFTLDHADVLAIEIIGGLLENDNPNTKTYATLLLNLENFLMLSSKEKLMHKVLNVCIAHLKFRETSLNSLLLEEFIAKEISSYKDDKIRQKLIALLSSIFNVVYVNEIGCKLEVAEFLITFDEETVQALSPKFRAWRSQYLANYYLSGMSTSDLIEKREFNTELTVKKFTEYCSTLNPVLRKIIEILNDLGNSLDSMCAESVLSVLVWKSRHSKKDFGKYLSFEDHSDTLRKYILPFDFHSCMLLNSEEHDMEYSIDNVVDQLCDSQYLQQVEEEVLCRQLCLFILEKISTFTSIAPLISVCVLRIPQFGLSIFPYLLIFTMNAFGAEGVDDVLQFFQLYMGLSSASIKIKKMISDSIIMTRYGAKQEYPIFMLIYEKINLETAILNCIKTKSFRMALLLLEDAYLRGVTLPEKFIITVYESIDNNDMIHGFCESLNDNESLIRLISLGNENTSRNSLYASAQYDAQLYFGEDAHSNKLLKTLLDSGQMGISRVLTKWEPGLNSSREWGWKLNRWEQPTTNTANHSALKYDELTYNLLQQVSTNPTSALEAIKSYSLTSPIMIEKNQILSVREKVVKNEEYFRCLGVILSIESIISFSNDNAYENMNKFFKTTSWFTERDLIQSEDILIARRNALQLLLNESIKVPKIDPETLNLCTVAEIMRYGEIARNNAYDPQKIVNSTMLLLEYLRELVTPDVDVVIKFNTALSLWKQGMTVESVNVLKSLSNHQGVNFPIESMCISKALINATLAEWLAISRQELATTIMTKYIEPTLNELDHVRDSSITELHLVTIYRKFAHFCQVQYSSGELLDQISLIYKRLEERKKEIDELKDHYGKTLVGSEEKRLAQRYYARLKQEYQVEHEELKRLRRLKETFAVMATQLYLKSVHVNSDGQWGVRDDFDNFFSLWFENKKRSGDSQINMLASEMPSKYFCDWASQLVSRLEGIDSDDEFQKLLQRIILKVSHDLPYNMLYPLMSLRISGLYEGDSSLSRKSDGANKIWRTLIQRENEEYLTLMNDIDLFCNESVKLAEFKGSKGRSINLDKLGMSGLVNNESKQLMGQYWLKNLPQICPPTAIKAYGTPDSMVPKMILINAKISVAASGLSLPKVATFVLSDGTEHRMLFKHGSDDLRQDSIMEQVFAKVNLFLNANKETRKRKLKIRTYNAVPLGPKSGIIEFVSNTSALVDILKPLHDAHDTYKMDKCRDMMRQVQSRDKMERLLTYERITEKCTPKLHYFFMSEFGTPDAWFECLLNYTHGVATTSFVGYMVGLGDRHCNNILIDKLSGEPVHIDLGVAFDLGKLLTVPETVPFRLTRDMVAGLGINGTLGVFTRSSEHVFKVLLENKDHIMTILDVLKWDPLYSWSLSPLKRKKLQDGNDARLAATSDPKRRVQVDEYEAQRAINTVADKLTGSGLSVEATVRLLIQEATNPENLALIYWGWSPFY